jgi:hypothetical protein
MRFRWTLTACILFLSGILPCSSLFGQASAETERDRWRTRLDLGLNSATGNTALTTLLTGISFKRLETEEIELEFSANYRYGKSDGTTVADLFQGLFKLDVKPRAVWSPFLFASSERNPVRRVHLRANGGAGLKHTHWRTERGKSSFSLATIFNYEDLEPSGTTVLEAEKGMRWSARFKLNLYFGEGAEYEFIVFHQPVWNDFSDYYFNADTSLRVPVTGGLSLVLRYEFRHDETPAEGVKKDDGFLNVSLRFEF